MKKGIFITLISVQLACFSQSLPTKFVATDQPSAPDYSLEKNWSALPFHPDKADAIPKAEKWVSDSLKDVDVFYIYPTLYSKGKTWCADVNDKKLNKRLDKLPVQFQASPFNQVARVYAPRYRQGIIKCFYDNTGTGEEALNFAYGDVKRAFEYYMEHYNHGRPVIIASHSQGTRHARQLLKDYFDTPEMKKKLVCAYIIGYRIFPEWYSVLTPCKEATETNCYITWASFKRGYVPEQGSLLVGKTCVNPISWTIDTIPASTSGGMLLSVKAKKRFKSTAEIHNDYLWVKTNTPFVQTWKVLHLMDYNLYWMDIRKNVALRVAEYMKKK